MLKGRVRVTLRPLLYRIPVVGAVQASWRRLVAWSPNAAGWHWLAEPHVGGTQVQLGCAWCPASGSVASPSMAAHQADLPHLHSAPQVSLVEQPEFDFDLTLGDSTNVPMESALKSWIKQ